MRMLINFLSSENDNPSSSTPPFIVNDRANRESSSERSTQSGNPSDDVESATVLVLFIVVMGILLGGAAVGMIFFSVRHKRYLKRNEEEKRIKTEDWVKNNRIEMVDKRLAWSPNVIGGEMGELSVEIEFE
jgi:hypothetical protein